MTRSIVFDMDGTLLDTIDFTLDAFQAALQASGYEPLPRKQLKSFLGTDLKGMSELLLQASGVATEAEAVKAMAGEIMAQLKQMEQKPLHPVVPYAPMGEIVSRLLEQNISLAVLSNSPHALTVHHVTKHFPTEFSVVLGEGPGVERKPGIGGVLKVLEMQSCSRDNVVLVGDSPKDYETAVNGGFPVIMVDWGVLNAGELKELGAPLVASDAESFFACLQKIWPDV